MLEILALLLRLLPMRAVLEDSVVEEDGRMIMMSKIVRMIES